jgi:hypothetical protein
VGGVVVAAVEEAEGVGGGEAAEELDEADFIVDFEIWSRHGCVCSINVSVGVDSSTMDATWRRVVTCAALCKG